MPTLYTIGHSNQSLESFLDLLEQHRIDAIADVRSQPYSRRVPWFSRPIVEPALKEAGIRYVFLGRELGARRDEPECYVAGTVDYDRIAATSAFATGLERLRKGIDDYRIALMCAEKDPLNCHRTILVAKHAKEFAKVQHILSDGSIEPHSETENRLLRRFGQETRDLFVSPAEMLDRAYKKREQEIAYAKSE